MADTVKVLAQSEPSAGVLTTAYTVPAGRTATVSSITVCNIAATTTVFRVAIRVGGASISNKAYIYYDLPLLGNDTFIATIGVTLAATDIVSVYSLAGSTSFNIFGIEVS